MIKREQISLVVVLWFTIGGAVITLIATPAAHVNSITEALLEFASQVSDPLSAEDREDPPFKPSQNAMADVDATLKRAQDSGKLALIVLGANWCHDSLGFVSHLNTPEMQEVLAAKYELQLVNVGPFEHGTDITVRFGQPVIYGTPTVFVVDPTTGQILNRKTMHQWRAAASISLADTVAYFNNLRADPASSANPEPENLRIALDEISMFEEQQAARIAHAYTIIGPLVVLDRDARPDNFYDMWEQVRVLRYKLTDDLVALRAMARRQADLSRQEIKLEFPNYKPFDWE